MGLCKTLFVVHAPGHATLRSCMSYDMMISFEFTLFSCNIDLLQS